MSPLPYATVMDGKDQGAKFEIRQRLVRSAQEHGIRSTAAAFRCSRNTVRLWMRRFEEGGAGALVERSRAPHRRPRKTSPGVERAVVRCRKQAMFMGPRRLRQWFGIELAHTTIGRILREHGLTRRLRRKHRTKQDLRAVKAQYKALRRLQMDVKYLWDLPEYWPWMTAFDLPRYQYTVRDVKSGALFLAFGAELNTTYARLLAVRLLRHLESQGVDLSEVVIQTDRGGEFSGQRKRKSAHDFTGLVRQTGAEHLFIPPRWPNANADVESSHRLIEQEFYEVEPFASREDFLRKATLYQHWFNYARTNGYKGGRTPWQILRQDDPAAPPHLLALPPLLVESLFQEEQGVGQDVSGLAGPPPPLSMLLSWSARHEMCVAKRLIENLGRGKKYERQVELPGWAGSFYRFWNWSSVVRAHGGCLGAGRRRRTRQAAISHGEEHASCDPWISEWGNPAGLTVCHSLRGGSTQGTETSKYLQEEKSSEIP